MDELIGFVAGNPKREKILSLLTSRESLDVSTVAKTTHIIEASAKKILLEMAEKGLLESRGELFSLTELGREVEGRIKGLR
jgi:predicted transcriptional regulator